LSQQPVTAYPERYEGATEGYVAYKKGFKYQLEEAAFCATGIIIPNRIETDSIIMDVNGDMWLAKGKAYDGASGPTLDTSDTMRLSAFHDAGYELERLGLLSRKPYRKKFDQLMYHLGREDGMWKIRIGYWLKGVRWFAGSAADPKNLKPVLYAPKLKSNR